MKVLKILSLVISLLISPVAYSQRRQPSIRSVDFTNFTYQAKPVYSRKNFSLKNGGYGGRLRDGADIPYPVSLVGVIYGDVTGEGSEDAMVVLTESVKGTAIPYYVYVYSIEKGRPQLLWSFETGDRGDGGLRKVYAENGGFVLELYGKDTGIGDIENKEETGACCPKSFTRIRYSWRGRRFRQKGSREVLPNPLPNAELLMS
ncbi:MAG TPA: hypothetical protein VE732_04510 [Nitrososphaera sp.]|jgi:hypothetical protein|nr:hypothetical protein [Nitrososphaera sp.]